MGTVKTDEFRKDGPDDVFDVCESGCFIVHVRGGKNGYFEKF